MPRRGKPEYAHTNGAALQPSSWAASYKTESGRPFRVAVESSECPVSLVRQSTRDLVRLFGPSRFALEATGATLYGPRLMDWPAKAYDVAMLIEGCRNEVEAARMEVENEEMRSQVKHG